MQRFFLTVFMIAACTAGTAAAQSPLLRADAVEAKRMYALATVQRLGLSARSQFDPQLAFGQSGAVGQKSCTFSIGDIQAAQAGATPLGQPIERSGLGRTEYITVVAGTQICASR